jgi:hypothetical protein|tara:strand:- start:273 stop:383 length:111 start_codon:yes stop_codon:yes gene_type:complete
MMIYAASGKPTATTGIPMPYLAYEDMNIEIDIIAMV